MKLENQVVSLELAKKLKALGVKQESLFYWVRPINPPLLPFVCWFFEKLSTPTGETAGWDQISAFTVAELGELLGIHLGEFRPQFAEETEADYRAKMLIYLIENEVIKI